MRIKGITKRWLLYGLGLIVLLIVLLETVAAVAIHRWYYNGVQQTIVSRSELMSSYFVAYNSSDSATMDKAAREFVESFEDKEKMELMILDRSGTMLYTTTGFQPDSGQVMPDYNAAVAAENGVGVWCGVLNTGEKVMAVTCRFHASEQIAGAVRIVVSMEATDRQVFVWTVGFLIIGMAVLFFVVMSGSYFINSIVNPVKEISATARQVAKGDFGARLEKKYDDEIGELCDTVNYMAQELGAAEKMKNDFISSVSHELRTPLTAIKGWAETMQVSEDNPGVMQKGVAIIAKESERLSGLVEELLDFSRIQSGRMTLMMDKVDLLAELDEAVYLFGDRAARGHIRLECSEPENLAPVWGDRSRLRQVFVNVLENAIKYSDDGGLVQVTACGNESGPVILIRDHGCGIAQKDLPKVKEKFYKANMTRGGSGIGLAVADEIVRLHDGSLEIESEEGKGTTVTIRLPKMNSSGTAAAEIAEPEQQQK
ncbi:MAG: HAMP domain-containing sensor histidine kinase [Firmicutes bacterium]|nr:HAMP domain-containing sensor histidine kinase [Bacillota bacterium]